MEKKMFQTTNQLQCVPVNIATSMFVCWNRYSWQCRGVLYPRSRPEFKHSEPYVSSLKMHSKCFIHEMPCSNSRASNKTNIKPTFFEQVVTFLRSSTVGWLENTHRILVQAVAFPVPSGEFPATWNMEPEGTLFRWSLSVGDGARKYHMLAPLHLMKNNVFVSFCINHSMHHCCYPVFGMSLILAIDLKFFLKTHIRLIAYTKCQTKYAYNSAAHIATFVG